MSLADCVYALCNNDICILPTETVYGLACSAFSVEAIKKVYDLKGRPSTNPLIVHTIDHESGGDISFTNEYSKQLADVFWPGPLTFILPKKESVPDQITAGLGTVAIRSPSHPVFRKVLDQVSLPIAAPSANPSNKLSPTKCQDAIAAFGKNCPPFLDGGQCDIGIESTVLDLTSPSPSILRLGPITKEAIENALGIQVQYHGNILNKPKKINSYQSPGQALKHYSPNTPLFLYSTLEQMLQSNEIKENDVVILPTSKLVIQLPVKSCSELYLSLTGDPKEITKNIFQTLNEADKLKRKTIHAALYQSDHGILSAVNDRLRRAATERF
mgnify:CR=1 FL=1